MDTNRNPYQMWGNQLRGSRSLRKSLMKQKRTPRLIRGRKSFIETVVARRGRLLMVIFRDIIKPTNVSNVDINMTSVDMEE